MKLAAAAFLPGAKSRLLPASIPFRFFAAAVVFHILLWVAVTRAAPEVPGFVGGPGMALAAVHMLTLGVLAMAAMGAAFQLLPVATRQPLRAVWPCRAAFWMFVPGVLALGHGMAAGAPRVMTGGAVLTAAALLVLAALVADNLRRARDLPLVGAHGWVAVGALVFLVVLGVALAADFSSGFLADHGAAARAHMILAGYGFMGMLAMGFSHILVPMFALSPAPDERLGRVGLWLAIAGLASGTVAALLGSGSGVAAAAALGLAAAAVYLVQMGRAMRARMRRRLGLSFVLIRIAWALLPVSLLLGGAAALGIGDARLATLAGFVLLFGWLLTFVMAILQRILPFLASMHAAKGGGAPPLVSGLTNTGALRAHAVCHLAALALIAAGITLNAPQAARLGGLTGLAGALAFAVFAATVIRRVTASRGPAPATPGGGSG